jgi:hypothetical protein
MNLFSESCISRPISLAERAVAVGFSSLAAVPGLSQARPWLVPSRPRRSASRFLGGGCSPSTAAASLPSRRFYLRPPRITLDPFPNTSERRQFLAFKYSYRRASVSALVSYNILSAPARSPHELIASSAPSPPALKGLPPDFADENIMGSQSCGQRMFDVLSSVVFLCLG